MQSESSFWKITTYGYLSTLLQIIRFIVKLTLYWNINVYDFELPRISLGLDDDGDEGRSWSHLHQHPKSLIYLDKEKSRLFFDR
ncbi:hypothetical protein RIR_jg28027.t1 [Rhizophagus irregularis DAOM 181602=DAOM 197198]|nr:hypothetical protein RIR_jg28027.t1 [Rhizophagus irregularis DAOM 181602=DAOM 197198]